VIERERVFANKEKASPIEMTGPEITKDKFSCILHHFYLSEYKHQIKKIGTFEFTIF